MFDQVDQVYLHTRVRLHRHGYRRFGLARVPAPVTARVMGPRAAKGREPADPSLDDRLRRQLEELVVSMCKALNDPKRLMLLYALRDEPRTVGELCSLIGVPQSNASQHLAVLRERGLVATERRGNSILYSLRYPRTLDAVDILREVMSEEVHRQQDLHSRPA